MLPEGISRLEFSCWILNTSGWRCKVLNCQSGSVYAQNKLAVEKVHSSTCKTQNLFLLSFFHLDSKFYEKKIIILTCWKVLAGFVEKIVLYIGQCWWRRNGYTFMNQLEVFLPMFHPPERGPHCFHLLLEQSLNHQCCYQHRTTEKFTFSFVDLLLGAEHFWSL